MYLLINNHAFLWLCFGYRIKLYPLIDVHYGLFYFYGGSLTSDGVLCVRARFYSQDRWFMWATNNDHLPL